MSTISLFVFALPALVIGVCIATLFEIREYVQRHDYVRTSLLHGTIGDHSDIDTVTRFGKRVRVVLSDRFPPAGLGGWYGESPIVYLNSAFVNQLTDAEKEAILAHEVAHIEHRDMIRVRAGFYSLRLLAYSALTVFVWKSIVPNAQLTMFPLPISWEVAFMILGGVTLIHFVLTFALARQREFLADRHAAMLVEDAEQVSEALENLVVYYSMDRGEPRLYRRLFSTHPSMKRRLEKLHSLSDSH